MNVIYTIVALLVVGIVLLIISFFSQDKFKQIENQIEQLSLSTLQDSYQTKKKLKVLEEELLPNQIDFGDFKKKSSPIFDRVESMYEEGYSIAQISQATQLSEYDVEMLINQLSN